MKNLIPLLIILLLMGLVYISGISHYGNFEYLQANAHHMRSFVLEHMLLSPLLYILLYIAVTALSLPLGVYISILGGFLFPQPYSTIFAVLGATLGASVLFLAARTAAGSFLKDQTVPFLARFKKGFKENAANYMLFLRIVPLFPFWLINLAPAFLGVPFSTFFWTTLLGIIPGTFVFTQIGSGLMGIFDKGEAFTVSAVMNRDMIIALVALGCWALVPVIYKKFKKN